MLFGDTVDHDIHKRTVTDEVSRALSALDLPELASARIEALGMRIANKLLHGPTTALREADDTTRAAIMQMFGLD